MTRKISFEESLELSEDDLTPNPNKYFYIFMILVMCRGFVDIIKIMHDSGADVTSKKLGGATPLFIAAQKGKVEAVRVLIELGAEVGYFFIIN